MPPDGRRDVLLEVLLSLVLGELLQLIDDVLVHRRLCLPRLIEGIAHHARFERPLVAVEGRTPGI